MHRMRRLVIIGAESHWIRQLVKGILTYCRVHGSWEFHIEADSRPRAVQRTREAIRQWKADGIIARIQSPAMERLIKDSGLPAVNVSNVRRSDLPTVISDNLAIGRMGARYFLDNRFQNLAFCARTAQLFAQQRCDGFVREVTKAGLRCEVFTHAGDDQPEWMNTRRKLSSWLLSLKKPVGVMCVYDPCALDVAVACRRLDLRVPDDVAIVGVGNEESLCLMCSPPLSSLPTQPEKLGYEAVRLLDRMLHGAKPPSEPILVPGRRVVVRQSSDIIAIDDRETVAAVRFIRNHAHEPVTIKDMLRAVPVCRRTLEQRFVKFLGRTPQAEFIRVRLQRAQDLLENTDLPIKGVVEASGFRRLRTFAYFFRREMGLTPTQYRRNCRMAKSAAGDCPD
jgi:LacI family transcriptional regulator